MSLRPWILAGALSLGWIVGGCGIQSGSTRKPALTERQRDSVIARSSLPGAGVVGRALQVSDRSATRAADLDSLTR